MVRPARKYPPTVPRLVRDMDWKIKPRDPHIRVLLSPLDHHIISTPSHPNADANDDYKISNDDADVRWVVDGNRDRCAILHGCTRTWKPVSIRLNCDCSLVGP